MTKSDTTPRLKVDSIYKIFGGEPDKAYEALKQGQTKDEILEHTGQTVAVQDANIEVDEGQIFVVMGLSGSGKSTLVRMLNGLIPPTSGTVTIDGEEVTNLDVNKLRQTRREKIAMVFQHFALFPHKTVADNVAYGLKVRGIKKAERREKALEALEQVGLANYADSFPDELSGGMQQRVGLARGLATDPQILLMDEPFSALDPLIRREMQDELINLQKSLKKTIIFITHDLNEALMLGDRIAIMKDGRFVQVGTAQEIVSDPADDYVSAFVADIDRSRVFSVGEVANRPEAVRLGTDDADKAIEVMESLNRNALYVTRGDRIAGVVTYQDLTTSGRENGADKTLEQALITDYPVVAETAQLYELYGPASSGLPIAVTDDEEKLVGVIEPQDVFAQLSGEQANGNDSADAGDKAPGTAAAAS